MKHYSTDVLVIGGGLAGVRAAVSAAETGVNVMVVGKSTACASTEVMGFNVPVHPSDSEELYYKDVMLSGAQINRTDLARTLIEGSAREMTELKRRGLVFNSNDGGILDTMRVLGASIPRLIRVGARTGTEALRLYTEVCRKLGVRFITPLMIADLVIVKGQVCGAVGFEGYGAEPVYISAGATVLATGGCGDIFPLSTYPKGMTGDGYAIAYRAGAKLIDMEFLQFEPCCFVYPEPLRGFVMVTTMLSEGGELCNAKGEYFMKTGGRTGYNVQKSELSKYIAEEIKNGRGTEHGGVYYDVTALPHHRVTVDNALFYEPALRCGVDITRERAEVAPVAHTNIGGILINSKCESSVPGLYAAGEVTGGVHGANRLGGCAGSEILVFGAIAGKSAAEHTRVTKRQDCGAQVDGMLKKYVATTEDKTLSKTAERISRLRRAISDGLGIMRHELSLKELLSNLDENWEESDSTISNNSFITAGMIQCENIITTARMQASASLMRRESRGVFFRDDYPKQDDENWKRNILIENRNGGMTFTITECE